MNDNLPPDSPIFCGSCGQKLLEGATFCAFCGTRVQTMTSPSASTQKTPPEYTRLTTPRPSSYPPQYSIDQVTSEPPLPFLQHFRGVLLQPNEEMPRVTKRPNLGQPFLIIIINGLLAGIALFILFSKVTITFSAEFYNSLGFPQDALGEINIEDYMELTFMLSALLTPIDMLINWLISSFILWGILSLLASDVPSSMRKFRVTMTISGWASLPQIVGGILDIGNNLIFVSRSTVIVNSIADTAAIAATGTDTPIGLIVLLVNFLLLFWSALLAYFAIKSLKSEGSQAVIITAIYTVVLFFFPVLLSMFVF